MPTLRPLNDILGIKYPHHCAACECDPWEDPGITADVMIDWLRQKSEGDFVFGNQADGSYYFFAFWDSSVRGYDGEQRGWQVEVLDAKTLQEGLERTVRAVEEYLT